MSTFLPIGAEMRTTKADGSPLLDQHENPQPTLVGEAIIVGLNNTVKANWIKKTGKTEKDFLEMFTNSEKGTVTSFYDIKDENGMPATALMSSAVTEKAGGRLPQPGDRWSIALSQKLDASGAQMVDEKGRGRMNLAIIGAPIADLNASFAAFLAKEKVATTVGGE